MDCASILQYTMIPKRCKRLAEVDSPIAEENELAHRIHDSCLAFYEEVKRYHQIAEQAYLAVR